MYRAGITVLLHQKRCSGPEIGRVLLAQTWSLLRRCIADGGCFVVRCINQIRGMCPAHFLRSLMLISGCPKPGHVAEPAPVAVARPAGMKNGDWICSHCQDHVFASRSACGRCRTPKPVGVGRAIPSAGSSGPPPSKSSAPARPGDWTCQVCGDNVFASKVYCRW